MRDKSQIIPLLVMAAIVAAAGFGDPQAEFSNVVNSGLSADDGSIELNDPLDTQAYTIYASANKVCIGGSTSSNCTYTATMSDGDVVVKTGLFPTAGIFQKITLGAPDGPTTLSASLCGSTIFALVDDASHDLPATIAGCDFTFVYRGADNGAKTLITPDGNDAIHGTCSTSAADVEFSGADGAAIKNTKATANTGDYITLRGDGSAGWYVVGCAGIWAMN